MPVQATSKIVSEADGEQFARVYFEKFNTLRTNLKEGAIIDSLSIKQLEQAVGHIGDLDSILDIRSLYLLALAFQDKPPVYAVNCLIVIVRKAFEPVVHGKK